MPSLVEDSRSCKVGIVQVLGLPDFGLFGTVCGHPFAGCFHQGETYIHIYSNIS